MGCSCSSTSNKYFAGVPKKKKKHLPLKILNPLSFRIHSLIRSNSRINVIEKNQIPIIRKKNSSKIILALALKLSFEWDMKYKRIFASKSHLRDLDLVFDRNFISRSLSDSEITSIGQVLKKLRSIQTLKLCFLRGTMEYPVCYQLFKFLKYLKNIKRFRIIFFRIYSEKTCIFNPIPLRYLRNLSEFKIGIIWSDVFENNSISRLFNELTRLQKMKECILNINHPRFTHEGFQSIIPSLGKLKGLQILRLLLAEDCYIVLDQEIDMLSENFLNLNSLRSFTFKIPSNEILNMEKYIKFTQYLSLLKSLQTLELKFPTQFNALRMNDLFYALKHLNQLITLKIVIYADHLYRGNIYNFDISFNLKSITHFQITALNKVKINHYNMMSQLRKISSMKCLIIDDPYFEIDEIHSNSNYLDTLLKLDHLEIRSPHASLDSILNIANSIHLFKKLKVLKIHHDCILLFKDIGKLSKLEEIDLTFSESSNDVLVGAIFYLKHNIEHLNLLSCLKLHFIINSKINSRLFSSIADLLAAGEHLISFILLISSDFDSPIRMSNNSFTKLSKGIDKLKSIEKLEINISANIDVNSSLTEKRINPLFQSASNLQHLTNLKIVVPGVTSDKKISFQGIFIAKCLSKMFSLKFLHIEFKGSTGWEGVQRTFTKQITCLMKIIHIFLKFNREEFCNFLECDLICDHEFE